jgi:hypothetical protein
MISEVATPNTIGAQRELSRAVDHAMRIADCHRRARINAPIKLASAKAIPVGLGITVSASLAGY